MSGLEARYFLVRYENNDRVESAIAGHEYDSQATAVTRAQDLRGQGQRVGVNKRVAVPGHADTYKIYGPDDELA